MPHLHPQDLGDVSYSVRHETPIQILANRVGVTSVLFALALGVSVLLGRPRP